MTDSEQNKSETATAYKLEQARKQGMIPRSQELGLVVSLLACIGYLWLRGDVMARRLAALCARALSEAASLPVGSHALLLWMSALLAQTLHVLAPLIGLVVGGALVAALIQTGFLFAPGALKVDMSKLNPIHGLKRLFSVQLLIEACKACLKMIVYTAVACLTIVDTTLTASHTVLSPVALGGVLTSQGLHLALRLVAVAMVFAAIDQVLVRRAFAKKMRMSRHEQKQELKQREGDPRIKQRRKQLQRELLQRARSLRAVRGADVVVTNPTHYAVGLTYEPATMSAPTVVAKGAGDVAQRLKKIAFIYGVPVIEAPALARQLFYKAAMEREIPASLYHQAAALYLRVRRASSATGRTA